MQDNQAIAFKLFWTTSPFRKSQGSTNSQSCDANFAHVVYRENGLDAGKSTSESTRIRFKMFSFLVFMLVFALQQVKTKFTTLGHVWPMKLWFQVSSRLRNLEDSENFACACVCAEFRFHLVHPYCLRLYCVASENQALERLKNADGEEEDNA